MVQLFKSFCFNIANEFLPDSAQDYWRVKLKPRPNMWACLLDLRQRGFNPSTIIDVGAYEGCWTRTVKRIFPASRVLMVEANPEKEKKLSLMCARLPGIFYSRVLVGRDRQEAVTFFQMGTGSSVLSECSNVRRNVIRLPMCTLDSVAGDHGILKADLLKLDVQGYELEVLEGAPNLLAAADCVLLETSLVQLNQAAPVLGDVCRFMTERGFHLYDICSLVRNPANRLVQTDLLFVSTACGLVNV